MRTEDCRQWRESLGAYALGHLSDEERVALEAHLEGCAECRAEAEALGSVASLLPHADPARFETEPTPPPALARRVVSAIGAERRRARLRRLRLRFTLAGATAAVAAALLAIFVLPGGESSPSQQVSFASLPRGMNISATLEPRSFGTQIHMYVSGVPSGTLCRVFVRAPGGARLSAGSFRYRWGGEQEAILGSALDLARTQAIGVRVGHRTFVAPVRPAEASNDNPIQEEST